MSLRDTPRSFSCLSIRCSLVHWYLSDMVGGLVALFELLGGSSRDLIAVARIGRVADMMVAFMRMSWF